REVAVRIREPLAWSSRRPLRREIEVDADPCHRRERAVGMSAGERGAAPDLERSPLWRAVKIGARTADLTRRRFGRYDAPQAALAALLEHVRLGAGPRRDRDGSRSGGPILESDPPTRERPPDEPGIALRGQSPFPRPAV